MQINSDDVNCSVNVVVNSNGFLVVIETIQIVHKQIKEVLDVSGTRIL